MSDFKVVFTLKQHTPLIHFQHDQTGATLRATELKPKLDRFLLQKEPNLPVKKHPNGSVSLDYKVKITPRDIKTEDIEKKNPKNGRPIPDPLFFGNMGDGKKKKFVTAESIEVEFKSFDKIILEAIEKHFEAFLANTNFGTRQSKGYGSFYIENKKFDPTLVPYKVYSFSSNNWKKDIKLFYSFLRAGINTSRFGGIYAKAVIFAFARSQGWTWDKKVIKSTYFNEQLKQQQKEHPEENNALNFGTKEHYLVRDLFGLSSEQSWMSYKATITKEHKSIDRFKSPITFKVVDKTVFFWANESVEAMLNEVFKIKCNRRGNLELSTPPKFSFDEFFKYAFSLNLANYIDRRFHNDRNGEYKTLVRIFKDIKENL